MRGVIWWDGEYNDILRRNKFIMTILPGLSFLPIALYIYLCVCVCVCVCKYDKKWGIQRMILIVVELFASVKCFGFYIKTIIRAVDIGCLLLVIIYNLFYF